MTQTTAGGAYESFSIADNSEADFFSRITDRFFSKYLRGRRRVATSVGYTVCGTLSGWFSNKFGLSYNGNSNYVWFLASDTLIQEAGAISISSTGVVAQDEERRSIVSTDMWSSSGSVSSATISWLLVRDIAAGTSATAVPAPAGLALVLAGLMGIARMRPKEAAVLDSKFG